MKCVFYERSNWDKHNYSNLTREQQKEKIRLNNRLHKKIFNTYVEFDFLPQVGMFINLLQFDKIFKLTERELELIKDDSYHWIREIEIRPDCLLLEFDWFDEHSDPDENVGRVWRR